MINSENDASAGVRSEGKSKEATCNSEKKSTPPTPKSKTSQETTSANKGIDRKKSIRF